MPRDGPPACESPTHPFRPGHATIVRRSIVADAHDPIADRGGVDQVRGSGHFGLISRTTEPTMSLL